jgi:hypothetical protein
VAAWVVELCCGQLFPEALCIEVMRPSEHV